MAPACGLVPVRGQGLPLASAGFRAEVGQRIAQALDLLVQRLEPTADLKAFPTPPGSAHYVVDADGFVTLPPAAIASEFTQDVSAEEANLIAATQGPVRGANFEQKVSIAAWTGKPSWYIVAGNDRMIDPGVQRALARKLKAHTTELAASHVPMVSQPQAVADVIAEAAKSLK